MTGKSDKALAVGASAGGHLNELMAILRAADNYWPMEPAIFITTLQIAANVVPWSKVQSFVIGECDRRKPLQLILVAFRSLLAVMRARPDFVVTTGSLPLAIYSTWAKLLGAKIIWIDSVGQVNQMSFSGRLMLRVADRCFVQWPESVSKYPGAEYAGEVM